jgi:predicted dehydrogenase
MKKVTAILIGAGSRGMFSYGPYAVANPSELAFVGVAEPDAEKREKFGGAHDIPDTMRFASWEDILAKPKMADAALICTQDQMHFGPSLQALKKGYHLLLEKPMATDPVQCIKLGEISRKYDKIFSICHVLRYAPFFSTLKKLLDEGRIGRLISIQHNENVGHWHQAHSFVRGNWNNSKKSSPMILAKSCHDMDLLLWLTGSQCLKVSSFGSLKHFRKENAPKGAPKRCTDGCPVEPHCPYSAKKLYLSPNIDWPTNVISVDLSLAQRQKALKEGPYGRCVYQCDNDVVDHQVVNIEFASGVTVAFTMCAFTKDISRTIKCMGTLGEIRGHMGRNELEIQSFNSESIEILKPKTIEIGHGGGDYFMMRDFVRLIQQGQTKDNLTSADISIKSHLMAFAAEKSRLENKVVFLEEYIRGLKRR